MSQRSKLISAILCLILFCQSCHRDPFLLQPPVHFPVQSIEQTPFKAYIDSLHSLGDKAVLGIVAGTINNPSFPHAEVPGQDVIGFAFRCLVAGRVTSLGIFLPSHGFSHTVFLLDSASQKLLAQADVPSIDSGRFTYVSLALANQAVNIQANHGYIVAFNTLYNGSALNTYSTGNNIYNLYGTYDLTNNNQLSPIMPFTQKSVSFEGYYTQPYNNILSLPIFPTDVQFITNTSSVFGVCDISFIPN
jgi:hypothetical protein